MWYDTSETTVMSIPAHLVFTKAEILSWPIIQVSQKWEYRLVRGDPQYQIHSYQLKDGSLDVYVYVSEPMDGSGPWHNLGGYRTEK